MKYSFPWLIVLLFLFSTLVVGLSIRGLPGNPAASELSDSRWSLNGPFELSPDRGRFALLYSIVENHSLSFSLPIAQFATPDLALSNGKYVSLFAPGLSFLLIPGYALGKLFGAAQFGTFVMVSLFAIANTVLIYSIARRLNIGRLPSILGASAFLLATPALTYAVTLYQHHITTFLLLLGIYFFIRWNNGWSLAFIWFLLAISLSIDYPNFFIFFPLGLYILIRHIGIQQTSTGFSVSIKPWRLLSILAVIPALVFFFGYNYFAYGSPWQLAGTLPQVKTITGTEHPNDLSVQSDLENITDNKEDKQAVTFFETRNLLRGFYIHFFSPDRGMVWYAPVIFLSILGMPLLYRQHPQILSLLVFTAGVVVVLYSMWGDPWGGWAFGSRYLIPAYALLSIPLAGALERGRWQRIILIGFLLLFSYGTAVNVLGALTSSANPPKVEVLALEKLSGTVQRYYFDRNWYFLTTVGSKSFIFTTIGSSYMTAQVYYQLITTLALIPIIGTVLLLFIESYDRR